MTQKHRPAHARRRRRRRAGTFELLLVTLVFLLAGGVYFPARQLFGLFAGQGSRPAQGTGVQQGFAGRLERFAAENGLSPEDWPPELAAHGEANPELETFVLQYPLEIGRSHSVDLSDCIDGEQVPRLYQWDPRWGYETYAEELMGLSGCGPTCLSMVCLYLQQDAALTPAYIARFSEENGYSLPGGGSSWTLISEGGPQLGLDVTEIPLDRGRIFRNLEVNNPIICVMGPGNFTSTGHFIVLTGIRDGKLQVNDPNSPSRSDRLWAYEDIQDQIRNLWVLR